MIPTNTPPRSSIRLSRPQQCWVYLIFALLFVSGLAWLVYHYLLTTTGSFGPERHPMEAWCLKVHGAASMAVLVLLGSLLRDHMLRAWKIRRNLRTALPLVCLMLGLIFSAYALYYMGDEIWRPRISLFHWISGIAATLVLALHGQAGKRSAAVKRNAEMQQSPSLP